MTSNADLVEALTFARRRLLAAFVAGQRGAEMPRPGRLVVAGVAAAGLLVAGAAIAAVVAPRAAIDWQGPALVVDEDTGALHVIADDLPDTDGPVLRPVANATSARLLAGDVAPQQVPAAVIASSRHGPPAGIPTAPAVVPGPDSLLDTGWTACTGTDLGVRVALSDDPLVHPVAAGTGIVVDAGGRRWLLAASRSYDGRVLARRHAVRDGTAGVGENLPDVGAAWLRLLPVGQPADEVDAQVPAPTAGAQVCAVLARTADGRPSVRLAVAPRAAASAQGVAPGASSVHVAPGHGAVVRSDEGTAYLVAERGVRHAVTDDALERLGLGGVEPALVPPVWLAFLDSDAALSRAAARCSPDDRADECAGSG